MAEKGLGASLLAEISRDDASEEYDEFRADVNELIATLKGYELVDAVIERAQRYAVDDFDRRVTQEADVKDPDLISAFRTFINYELTGYLSHFVTDSHRKFIVRCHARGLSTSDAVTELVGEDETMNRLAETDAIGWKSLKQNLVSGFSYLKPGTARWPEKKYGAVWREALEAHRQEMSNVRLTSKAERVALLAKHAERIDRELEGKTHESKDFQALTKSLTQTLESLSKLSAEEGPAAEMLSPPQLVGVIERLTLALRTPEQNAIGGDAEQLVGVLEKLTLALKAPGQKTDGNGANALPAPTDSDGDNAD